MNSITLHPPGKGKLRVIALGDCNTNTIDLNQGTVPDGFCDALNTHGYSVELTNLGRGMETSREGLARLIECDAVADVAIINYGLVDAWVTTIPGIYVPYYPDGHVRKRLRKLLKFLKRRLLTSFARKFLPVGSVVPAEEFSQNISRMISIIRSRNSATKFVLWGTVPVTDNAARNEQLVKYNEILQETARQNDASFVDTDIVLNDLENAERHLDGVHISPETARRIGSEIFRRIQTESACDAA